VGSPYGATVRANPAGSVNNKLFALLLVGLPLVFCGWMAYDMRQSAQAVSAEGVKTSVAGSAYDGTPLIEYDFRPPEPVYSHQLTIPQIEALRPEGQVLENGHVPGITIADFDAGSSYRFNYSHSWFRSQIPLWLESLTVRFSYKSLNVYVTSSYTEGTCQYQEILDHENHHVDIHRQVYLKYQLILRQALENSQALPTFAHPILVSSVEEGQKQLDQIISGILDPVFKQFQDELTQAQGQLDTPESYAALQGSCTSW
jgi:hypothetical protein